MQAFRAVVHPFPPPPGFRQTPGLTREQLQTELCAHVERYPPWVLAVVVPRRCLVAGVDVSFRPAERTRGSLGDEAGDFGRSPVECGNAALPGLVSGDGGGGCEPGRCVWGTALREASEI
jgi:hypothetical protein